ncbi:MAG: hypothetical protein EGQ20_11995 [Bacteroides oleiciplenus]|nr:hypothetical protein [Bacteroides oleiciplenus]
MKEESKKEKYVTPQIEIIEVENEGVIALSDMSGGNPAFPTRSSARKTTQYRSASSMSDLEDLINDILTVNK